MSADSATTTERADGRFVRQRGEAKLTFAEAAQLEARRRGLGRLIRGFHCDALDDQEKERYGRMNSQLVMIEAEQAIAAHDRALVQFRSTRKSDAIKKLL